MNHEVPRKVYEVQEIKNYRSTKEDAAETSKRQEEKTNQTPNAILSEQETRTKGKEKG